MRPRDATPKPGKENPMPRPTKYDPSYCDKAIEWGRQGKANLDCG